MLHIAPERCLQPLFNRAVGLGYLTADLHRTDVMERMDITDINHPDDSFDAIYCSHVLEHVDNDRQALHEFYRILRIGGWAVLNVPITAEHTFEDPSVTDPDERTRLFGQDDHVRRYGPDYSDRLKQAGFEVAAINAAELVPEREAARMGIATDATGSVHYCRKAG
jgi:SAM-dependent methyltransferase